MYSKSIKIRFDLADPAGILFYAHFFRLAHEIYEDFVCECLKIPWNDWFQNPHWGIPIIHCAASFKDPLRAGELIRGTVQIKEIRKSSFELLYHFKRAEQVCIIGSTIHIFIDLKTKSKQTIPTEILTLLKNKQNSFQGSL